MADNKRRVGHAYNVDFLNVVFAASSVFLFLSIVWMVWDDYDREWKTTQRRFAQLEYQVTQAQLQQATMGLDRNKLQQLEAARQVAGKSVAANQKKVDDFEASRANKPGAAKNEPVIQQAARAVNEVNLHVEKIIAEKSELQRQLGQYTGRATALGKQIDDLTSERNRLRKRLDVIAPSLVKDYFRNAPLLDFMAPTINGSNSSCRTSSTM